MHAVGSDGGARGLEQKTYLFTINPTFFLILILILLLTTVTEILSLYKLLFQTLPVSNLCFPSILLLP